MGCCLSIRPFVDGGVEGGLGSKRGGEVNQVIYQRNVWRETWSWGTGGGKDEDVERLKEMKRTI